MRRAFSITSANVGDAAGTTAQIKVKAVGSTIYVYWNGWAYINGVTETFNSTATRHGVYWLTLLDYGSKFDNFRIDRTP